METVDYGRVSIEIPVDCPDISTFRDVTMQELKSSFGADKGRASFAAAEYGRCQEVPEPFAGNQQASSLYQRAQMSMSPAARQWEAFEHNLMDRFSDYCLDDGSAQTPAIPGWRLEAVSARNQARAQEQQQPGLDQAKVVELDTTKGQGR